MTITVDYLKNCHRMKDFQHVVALATRKGRVLGQRIFYAIFGVLGLGSGVLLLLIYDQLEGDGVSSILIAVLGLLAGAFFAVRALFYYQYLGFFSGRVMRKRLAGYVSEVRYTFGEEEMTVDDALEHCSHPYSVFQGCYESRRLFVLLLTPRTGYFISKEDLEPGEEEALRALLTERLSKPPVYYDV